MSVSILSTEWCDLFLSVAPMFFQEAPRLKWCGYIIQNHSTEQWHIWMFKSAYITLYNNTCVKRRVTDGQQWRSFHESKYFLDIYYNRHYLHTANTFCQGHSMASHAMDVDAPQPSTSSSGSNGGPSFGGPLKRSNSAPMINVLSLDQPMGDANLLRWETKWQISFHHWDRILIH